MERNATDMMSALRRRNKENVIPSPYFKGRRNGTAGLSLKS